MLLIKNCYLIDGVSDNAIENAAVIIKDGVILYSGSYSPELDAKYSPDEVIDVKSKTVMPGLIDAHVHLCMDGAPDNFEMMIMCTANKATILGVQRAQKTLSSGFTTIRCCGEKGEIDIDIRNAINEGIIVGPRVLASGKALTITGGHGDMFPSGMEIDGIGEICDGIDGVIRGARRRIKRRVDNIKLMATGGGMSPGPATVAQLNEDEMRAAVIEAEKNGICTAAHCIGEEGINNAIRAGVRTIEHGSFLNDEGIRMMVEKGTYLMSTLAAFKTIMYGEAAGVPEQHLKKVQFFATNHYKNLRMAIAAGVKVGCGTDTGTPFNFHGDNAYELECLVENGMTEMQAIKAATSVTAEAVLQKDIGALTAGMTADLLIVDGNPLNNIKILQNKDAIRKVYRSGKLLVDRDANIIPGF